MSAQATLNAAQFPHAWRIAILAGSDGESHEIIGGNILVISDIDQAALDAALASLNTLAELRTQKKAAVKAIGKDKVSNVVTSDDATLIALYSKRKADGVVIPAWLQALHDGDWVSLESRVTALAQFVISERASIDGMSEAQLMAYDPNAAAWPE